MNHNINQLSLGENFLSSLVPVRKFCLICGKDISHQNEKTKICGKQPNDCSRKHKYNKHHIWGKNYREKKLEISKVLMKGKTCLICGKDISHQRITTKVCGGQPNECSIEYGKIQNRILVKAYKAKLRKEKNSLKPNKVCLSCGKDISHQAINTKVCGGQPNECSRIYAQSYARQYKFKEWADKVTLTVTNELFIDAICTKHKLDNEQFKEYVSKWLITFDISELVIPRRELLGYVEYRIITDYFIYQKSTTDTKN